MKKNPKKGISVDDPKEFHNFYNAVAQKNYVTANNMLEAGWNINVSWCFSPLIMAIHDGDLDAIKWLINKGADVNYPDSCGIKPLTRCVLEKNYAAAELLLQQGANPNSQDGQFCSTAFMSAVEEGLADIVGLLFKHGLKINKSPELYGLAAAAKHRHTELCEILLDFGFPVELKEIPVRGSHAYAKINYSPLGYTAIHNDIETCRLLLKYGANPDAIPEHDLNSAVENAVEHGSYETAILLLQSGAHARSRKQVITLTNLPKFSRKESSNTIFKEIINIHSLELDEDEKLDLWITHSQKRNYELLEFMLEKGFTLENESLIYFDDYTKRMLSPDYLPLDVANHARSLLGLTELSI
jgi:ankyrin repeat protein